MMKKSKRLQPVVKLAEFEEQGAAKELGECQKQLENHQDRLLQLVDYRGEYLKNVQTQAARGISAQTMVSYQNFISQLDRGIEEQNKVIERFMLELERKRQMWFSKRTKTQAMDKVMSKYLGQELREENKREQRDSDERAQTMKQTMLAID